MTISDLRTETRANVVWMPVVAAIVVVLSLGYPLIAPVVAIAGGFLGFRLARAHGSRWAWALVGVSAAVLVAALVVDLGLLAATTVQMPGVRQTSGS